MSAFVLTQIDYLFFVYGLSFLCVSVIAFFLYKNNRELKLWFWLGLFGIAQCFWAWMEIGVLIFINPTLNIIKIFTMAGAFICLMEGARRDIARSERLSISTAIYTSWLSIPAVGGMVSGVAGADAFIRYFYGVIGGAVFSWRLWRAFRRATAVKYEIYWLRWLSVILFVNCLIQGVPVKGSFFPADVVNVESFRAQTGYPIQLLSMLLMLAGVVCIWQHYVFTRRVGVSGGRFKARMHYARLLMVAISVTLFFGWLVTERIGRSSADEESRALLNTARTFAAAVGTERLSRLSGTAKDVTSQDYLSLRNQALAVDNSLSDVRYIYLFGRKDGRIFFYFDSESEGYAKQGGKLTAMPGDIYEELTPGLAVAFDKGKTVFEGPYDDPWGKLLSALVPIKDQKTGVVIAVLGVDVEAKSFEVKRLKHRLLGILLTLLLLAMVMIFFIVQQRNRDIQESLKESERKYKGLFDEMLSGLAVHEIICDGQDRPCDYRFIDVNSAFEKLTGLSRQQVVGKTIREIVPDIEPEWIWRYGEVALHGGVDHFEQYSAPFKKYFECRVFSPEHGKFAVTFEDITRRREAMENLAMLLVRLQTQREVAVAISRKISEEPIDLSAALRFLTEATAKAVAVERVSVWLGGEDSGFLECIDLYRSTQQEHLKGMLLALEQCPLYFKALANGDIIEARDAQRDLRTGELAENYFKPQGILSTVDAPIMVGGKVIGVLRFEHTVDLRIWHTDEIRFASEAADQVEQLFLLSDRRKAVETLERNYAFLQVLIDTIPNPVYFQDAQARYQGCNKAFATLLGFAREDIIGKTVYTVAPKELAEICETKDAELLATGGPQTYEGVIRAAGGALRDVVFYKAIWSSSDGNPVGIVGVMLDITDRKRMELTLHGRTKDLERERENLQLIFDSIPSGLLLLNGDGEVQRANNTVLQLTSRSPDEIFGRRFGVVLCCVHATAIAGCGHAEACLDCAIRNTFNQVLETGQKFTGLEVNKEISLGGQGRSLWFELNAGPVCVNGSRHVILSIIDITTRKQAELSQKLSVEVLRLLNQPNDLTDVIKDLLPAIKMATGLDAVGVRFRKGAGYPYYSHIRFLDEFLPQENSVPSLGEVGALLLAATDRQVVDCADGLVLSDPMDISKSFFTAGGSFWINNAQLFRGASDVKDPRIQLMNYCISAGYMSVALIPIRVGQEMAGILQLNDRRPGRFTEEMIQIFEGIGSSIGVALARKADIDALRECEEKFRTLVEKAPEAILIHYGGVFVYVNEWAIRLFGAGAPGDLLGHSIWERLHPDYHAIERESMSSFYARGLVKRGEEKYLRMDGGIIDVDVSATSFVYEGRLSALVFLRDITGRKRM